MPCLPPKLPTAWAELHLAEREVKMGMAEISGEGLVSFITPSFYEGRLRLHLESALLGDSAGLMEMVILGGQNSTTPTGRSCFPGQSEAEKKDGQGALVQRALSDMMHGCP